MEYNSKVIKDIYTGGEFRYIAEQNFKDEMLCENFLKWCNHIDIEFVDADYKEEWGEGGCRGNIYTIYLEFFKAFVIDIEDMLAFMVHEYLHHVCDRVLWGQVTTSKKFFTIKELNFIEDMYINGWMEKDFPGISDKWQSFLSNHDMFHGLSFDDEEKSWNSLLTSDPIPCHNTLTNLYEYLREDNKNLLEPKWFAYYVSMWNSILKHEKKVKYMINNLQINKEEWSYETCTPCETKTGKRKEEKETV